MRSGETYCDHCGYDLAGLNTQGHCPECGTYFNTITHENIRRPASAADQSRRAEAIVARLRTILCAALAALFTGISSVAFLVFAHDRLAGIAAVFACFCVLAAITSYVYEKSE